MRTLTTLALLAGISICAACGSPQDRINVVTI
jgi:hypothetical protein